jgi:hypothetical protein
MNEQAIELLKKIKPGKTYPTSVTVTEPNGMVVKFLLCSYFVGMYCAIHLNGNSMPVSQTGDRNNIKFCRGLKRDLNKAIARGAVVEIGTIRDCQLTMPK